MAGLKMTLVHETLNFLLNFLGEKDRICLIEFDDYARRYIIKFTLIRLTPLLKVTEKNKKRIANAIDSI
jgi:hypothetical protein